MAKKTAVKKPKRRLKRTARRSLAAVLMITAVVVAAIPVPENAAADPATTAEYMARATDVHVLDGSDGYTAYKYNPQPSDDVSLGVKNFDLSSWAGSTDTEMSEALKNPGSASGKPKLYASYLVSNPQPGTYSLGWQFMYYEVNNPRGGQPAGAICKYNTEYYTDEVKLDLFPYIEYFTASLEDVDKYYKGDMTDNVSSFQIKDDANKVTQEMDNDPTKTETVYTYKRFNSANGGSDEEVKAFLAKYPSLTGKFNDKIAEYQKYKADKDAYDKDTTNKVPDPGPTPEDFKITPANELSAAEKLKYFCEHNLAIGPGTGYTLVAAKDNRPGEEQGDVYLAQGGKPAEGSVATNDEYGMLVLKTSKYQMCAIANKAFYEVGNIKNINIPGQIGYIGDDAFAGSKLEGVTFDNVTIIGNRAFKNCVVLSTAVLELSTEKVGAECFSGTKIQAVKFGSGLRKIGYGAFSDCRSLTAVSFESNGQQAEIDGYAFYNCPILKTVDMKGANIRKFGDGVFASDAGSEAMGFTLPEILSDPDGLGNYLFAGRSSLEYVVFPKGYGHSSGEQATVPPAMFHGCSLLKHVDFPADYKNDRFACGFVSYDPKVLFADVIDEDFYVRGPELNEQGSYAKPRECTWVANTAVSNEIPYVYVDKDGNEYYEVSDGYYLLSIDSKGILRSCTLSPNPVSSDPWDGELKIPDKVGGTKVIGIASDCFGDSNLNEQAVSLKIADGSIEKIDAGVFKGGTGDNEKDWLKLKKVYIGNSVKEIGNSAFEGCSALVDVTFSSPQSGHEAFVIGTDAFKTGSTELTFHGDIVKGYAPFEWAMAKDNIIKEPEGIRVCYQSLIPTFLTVMYDEHTGLVTLLDYPKMSQVSSLLNEVYADDIGDGSYGTYEKMREAQSYAEYSGEAFDSRRDAFKTEWMEGNEAAYDSENYGPWITPEYVDRETWTGGTVPPSSSGGTTSSGTTTGGGGPTASAIADFLFEPIVAYAADKPQPYYTKHPFKLGGTNTSYPQLTTEEIDLLDAVHNIVVPEGVESIDVYGYINDSERNKNNAAIYLERKLDTDVYRMYTSTARQDADSSTRTVPGLFSGYYDDGLDADKGEKYKRGNDLIESVSLKSVKYLPDYAFDSCERLLAVDLGPACADIGTAPFRGCYEMVEVGDNDYYTTENGIIYSKNADGSLTIEECLSARGRKTEAGPAIVSLATDPNMKSVSAIKPGAFEDCDDLTAVNFGSNDTAGLSVIPEDCFKNCDNLQTIVLPATTNDIGKGAFAGANSLRDLTIYGDEVKISGSAFDTDKTVQTTVRAYENSAVVRYVNEYGEAYKLYYDKDNPLGRQWKVTFYDAKYQVIENMKDDEGNALDNPQYVTDGEKAVIPEGPVLDGWTFEDWVGMNNANINKPIREDTIFYAQGHFEGGTPVDGKWVVEFFDGVDGQQLAGRGSNSSDGKYYVDAGKSFADMGWTEPLHPTHAGFEPAGFSSGNGSTGAWTAQTVVNGNLSVIALYKAAPTSGGSTNTPGTPSGGTTSTGTTSNGTTSSNTSSSNSSSSKNSSSSSSSSSSSTSTTSTTSGAGQYTVFVESGSGSGSYAPGTTVIIQAAIPAAGMRFDKWTTESNGVTLASVSMPATTFTMPSNNVTIKANYVEDTAPSGLNTSGTGGGGGGNTVNNNTADNDDGNTRVDIEKPGISNRDLATANVNGSTDNFIVKISETDEATRAVAAALTNKYGTLDNILYYAMDISLYDSTGTTKITNTTGLSVDITIPIPDSLVAYGGNNMAGAVINGDQLESLNENFTTINGVPCIRFRATHFSPYTIYVDTGNLVEGMLDTTPQTGDPIHPKWFLSLGLACLSMILFLKRDKRKTAKVKA